MLFFIKNNYSEIKIRVLERILFILMALFLFIDVFLPIYSVEMVSCVCVYVFLPLLLLCIHFKC